MLLYVIFNLMMILIEIMGELICEFKGGGGIGGKLKFFEFIL